MSDPLQLEVQKTSAFVKPKLTEFFSFLKNVFRDKPNALELFITLAAIEKSTKGAKEELWGQMDEKMGDMDHKEKHELRKNLLEVASRLSSSPEIKLEGEKQAESKIWTPEKKEILRGIKR